MSALPDDDDDATALQANTDAIRRKFPKCPADLLEVAARAGSINKAATASNIAPPDVYRIARGGPATPLMQERIDRALKIARGEKQVEHLKPGRHYGHGDITGYPPLLQQLIELKGSIVGASRAIGYRSTAVLMQIRNETHEFTEELQNRVKEALTGKEFPLTPATARTPRPISDDPDTGEMGIAIVLAEQKIIESIYDAGEAMGGSWIFRMRIDSGQWLVICKLDEEALKPFKMLVRLVADKVVTP